MRLDRLTVKNFRNLADVDIKLAPGTVIVGENRTGKSNLIHALRLVLDTGMSLQDRTLQKEDFWFGLSDGSEDWDPMKTGHEIEISLELSDFGDSPEVVTALSHALTSSEDMRAALTYQFAPAPGESRTFVYKPRIFGGHDPARTVSGELRSYIHLAFQHALRDVESDIKNWRRSPLRRLLERAAAKVSEESLSDARDAIREANATLSELDEIRDLGERITKQTKSLVGEAQSLETNLAVASPDPLRLLRSMRIFVDGDAARPLHTSSLGSLNVLYFALLQLGLAGRLDDVEIAHVVMAIEEPEAHLHPHLQRLVFGDLLESTALSQTVLVTTQSPHIASVANPENLVVLREVSGQTVACAASTAALEAREWADVSRYLDATRAEIVFARRVLLVEGYAEQVLIPRLASELGISFDEKGLTVCSIHGTHFSTYVRFCESLGIPWAVLTDGDPDSNGVRAGDKRAQSLVQLLGRSNDPQANGVFVGVETFEHDLFMTSPENRALMTLELSQDVPASHQTTFAGWEHTPPTTAELVSEIKAAGGKGRFAQRLASSAGLDTPSYVRSAIEYLVAK